MQDKAMADDAQRVTRGTTPAAPVRETKAALLKRQSDIECQLGAMRTARDVPDVAEHEHLKQLLSAEVDAIERKLQRIRAEEVDAVSKQAGMPGTLEERIERLETISVAVAKAISAIADETRMNRSTADKKFFGFADIVREQLKKLKADLRTELKPQAGMVWVGPYEDGKGYAGGQVVRHAGDVWVCSVDTATEPTTDNPMWNLVLRGVQ